MKCIALVFCVLLGSSVAIPPQVSRTSVLDVFGLLEKIVENEGRVLLEKLVYLIHAIQEAVFELKTALPKEAEKLHQEVDQLLAGLHTVYEEVEELLNKKDVAYGYDLLSGLTELTGGTKLSTVLSLLSLADKAHRVINDAKEFLPHLEKTLNKIEAKLEVSVADLAQHVIREMGLQQMFAHSVAAKIENLVEEVEEKVHVLILDLLAKMEQTFTLLEEELPEVFDALKHKVEEIRKGIHDVVQDIEKALSPGLHWVNTSRALSVQGDLQNRVVVLDFFTYCCINCMHILPELKRIEKSFPPSVGLVVIGVHSAKFENEKLNENLQEAVLRYDIEHPVVNDPEAYVWNALQVQCWPTLIILGPDGHALFALEGEGTKENLHLICETVLEYFNRTHSLTTSNLPMKLLKNSLLQSVLYYPGKVCVGSSENFVVSDTGHHRIVIVARDGTVKDIIGSGEQGFQDGSCHNAQFNSPQGVAWEDPGLVFVADTGNHAIRLINLKNRTVETIVGNGTQGSDQEGGQCGTLQSLNSPWDLCLGPGIGSDGSQNEVLYIAMAGSHQIWALCLKDCRWLKGSVMKMGCCMNFAGSGMEENRNNSYPHRAGFAQPSGITLCKGESACLLVADSESSTIRSISLGDGSVKGIVGGSLDPQNLFAFGDKDGTGLEAKLQHPLGICSFSSSAVYVADSYNHKIKILNLLTKECKTFCGSGACGNKTGSTLKDIEFNEPGGLCITNDGKIIIVTDTNNHCIKLIDTEQESVLQLPILIPPKYECKALDVTDSSLEDRNGSEVEKMSALKLLYGGTATFVFKFHVDDDLTLTEGAPHQWNTHIKDGKHIFIQGEDHGVFDSLSSLPPITVCHQGNHNLCTTLMIITLKMYLCRKSTKSCFPRKIIYHIPLEIGNIGPSESNVTLPCKLK